MRSWMARAQAEGREVVRGVPESKSRDPVAWRKRRTEDPPAERTSVWEFPSTSASATEKGEGREGWERETGKKAVVAGA